MLTSILAVWLLNVAAFWLAEILVSPTPIHHEPWWVMLAALASYLAIATAAALGVLLGFALAARTGLRRTNPSGSSRLWLAFLPGALLLLPRFLYVAPIEPGRTATLLVLLLGASGVVAFAWSRAVQHDRPTPYAAYVCGSLALWTIALSVKHVASDVPLTAPTIAPSLVALWITAPLLLVLTLLMSLAARARLAVTVALAGTAAAVLAAHVFAPPVLAPLTHGGCEVPSATRAIPVILIVMDTTRADHLSVYGYPRGTTPELERFAGEALVFDDAVAPSSWTLPSHASLFTGLFPLRHGADRPYWLAAESGAGGLRPGLPLGADHLTLAEWLHDHCYDTAAVAANFGYLDPAFGLDQGFAFYDTAPSTPVEPRLLSIVHRRVWPLPWAARFWRTYRSAEQVNRVALRWLGARRSDAVFLFVNYMETHGPWPAPGRNWKKFAAESQDPRSPIRQGPIDGKMRAAIDLYDSHLASLDHAIGELLDGLRRLGLYDPALIIVTADHGESLGENDVVGHGRSLQRAEVGIPLLIKYPHAARTGRDATRVQLIDVFPTIAAVLGTDVPRGLEGAPIDAIDHPILAELYRDPRVAATSAPSYQVALYEGSRKLLVRDEDGVGLFDLEQDPSESHELHSPDLDAMAADRSWLLARRRSLEDGLRRCCGTTAPLDPTVRRALQALGYLDDDTHAPPE